MSPVDGVQNNQSVRPENIVPGELQPPPSLSEPGKAIFASLQSLNAEASDWVQLGLYTGDRPMAEAGRALNAKIAAAVTALAQGKDADAAAAAEAVVAELHAFNAQKPASALPPKLDTAGLEGEAAQVFAAIGENRMALVNFHKEAVDGGRGDIARQIAGLIRQLDVASTALVQHPDKAQALAGAKKIGEGVTRAFNKIDAAWDPKVPVPAAERAMLSTLTPLAKEATGGTGGAIPQPLPDRPGEQRPGTGTTTAPDARMDAIEARLLAAENENRLLRERIETKEKAEAEEARKPGFFRALIEAMEFLLRWFTPFINMLSAIFRVLKIGYKLLTGQKVDWMEEGARLAGDIAGIFFPPIGAIANAGINLYTNKSQILGGVNELFDDAEVKNPYREGLSSLMGGAGKVFNGAKKAVLGDPKDEVERREAIAAQST